MAQDGTTAEQVRQYLRRATDFFDGMRLMQNDEGYRNSSALLAIHSAISFSDALRTGLGDRSLASDDHGSAVSVLRDKLRLSGEYDQSGLNHLRYLIQRKSDVAYGDRRLENKMHLLLVARSERFAAWVNRISGKLRIEGWDADQRGETTRTCEECRAHLS